MPTKKKVNKLSQVYKTIDQRELSQDAKNALTKLRVATGNFRKSEGKEADAFMLFYNRLVSKKPTAVKTTPEYKAMIKERQRENGRKMLEAKKAKQESRQGQGSERDASRPAKPFGWRLKGKHNYRKPTRADISSGRAYYEGRINRADSKRTKFPMLERGGYMEHGGDVDKGGMIYALREFVSSGQIANKTDVLNYDDIAKIRRIAIQYYMDNGDVPYSMGELDRIMDYANDKFKSGYMANGGETKFAWMKAQAGDSAVVIEENKMGVIVKPYGRRFHLRFPDGSEKTYFAEELYFIFDEEYAKGGNVYSSDDAYEAIILKDGVEVDRVLLRAKNKGEARMMYEDYHEGKMMKNHGEDITYEVIVAPSKMAKGGEVFYRESHKNGHK